MKKYLHPTTARIFAITACLFIEAACFAASFSITPAVVNNQYNGLIALNIGGLTNGESVVIQKVIDVNGNGTIDPGEPMADSFRIVDGGAMVIGGITNLSVPFDSNPQAGAITTSLNIAPPRPLGSLVGQFVFSLSSPVGNFSTLTATLTITNADLPQSVSGTVYRDETVPLPYAVVVVLETSTEEADGRWVTGAITDQNGHYRISLAPGSYVLMPACPGFFADLSRAAMITLSDGNSATNDLFLQSATATISGKIYNSGNSNGVAGLMLPVDADNRFAIGFTDGNGDYTMGVAPGLWKIKAESDMVISRAFVVPKNGVQVDTTTGSVANINIGLTKANAMFYGRLTNAAGLPLANVSFSASDVLSEYEAGGITGTNGHFRVGVLGGTTPWYCGPDESDRALAGYLLSHTSGTNISVGQALALKFYVLPATARISGRVQDPFSNAVVGLGIIASTSIGGVEYSSYAKTDEDGHYSLPAASGTWRLAPNCCGDDGLDAFHLAYPITQEVTIPPTNTVVNLTLYPYDTPAFFGADYAGSSFAFMFNGTPATTYIIQTTTNLASTNWSTFLVTNLSGSFAFLNDQMANRQRFYRVLKANQP